MAHLMVVLMDHQDLFGRLDEDRDVEWRFEHIGRYAGGPAAFARDVGYLSVQHLLIGAPHLIGGPGLEDRIFHIRDAVGRLYRSVGLGGHKGMRGIIASPAPVRRMGAM